MKKRSARRARAMTAQRLLPQHKTRLNALRDLAGKTLLKLRTGVPIFPRELREHRHVLAMAGFFAALGSLLRGIAKLLFLPAVLVTAWIFTTRLFGGEEVSFLLWIFGLGASGLVLTGLLALTLIGAFLLLVLILHQKL
ncbi:hypothetical protein [Falsigemmobacter faecalis]|uniref:Uncharacterized protein n=1 Tax=Falsigemmobacter faecalis TaxID=2488730 RepID=A0A3P3DNJ7_9RHOB|nr:hypothetical protein [Falsigemmobacter faecalis]RRH75810.1 hypothetical protein EG244_07740 [Falsigemmobacter faecalis]